MPEQLEDGVYAYGDKQYQIVHEGTVYNTDSSEFLGCLPVFGGTIELYKDSENGYFTMTFSHDPSKKPAFGRLPEKTAMLWAKGIERYWETKQNEM